MMIQTLAGISSRLTGSMNGLCLHLLRPEVRNIIFTLVSYYIHAEMSLQDMKFVLLHEGKNDDGIKSFFMDVWELYVKVGFFCYIHIYKRKLTPFVGDDESFPYCA